MCVCVCVCMCVCIYIGCAGSSLWCLGFSCGRAWALEQGLSSSQGKGLAAPGHMGS